MFDFEKLDVYQKAKAFYSKTKLFLKESKIDSISRDQLQRASFSIVLNIAEGTGRFTPADKSHFYVTARSSLFECIAALDTLHDENLIADQKFNEFYSDAEDLSKILFAMIKGLGRNPKSNY
ncbi:MAG: four helix bundle protein [Bacteroidales bacterium]|nr:four helix bundle protein [Bacteroidales bacterium]